MVGCEPLFDLGGLTGGREADAQGAPEATGDDAVDEGVAGDAARPEAGEEEGGGLAPEPQCTCLPQVPSGWVVVAFSAAPASACPGGYDAGIALTVDPSLAPVSCSCTCGSGAPPTCTTGTVADKPQCGSTAHTLSIGGGACTAFDFGTLASTHELVGPPPNGGSCAPTATMTAPSTGTSGFACSVGAAPSRSCGSGGVCAPSTAAPFAVCIAHSGSVACPSGYPLVHAAGTSLNDSRACKPDRARRTPWAPRSRTATRRRR
jgi:hypothetical protein